MRIIQKQCDLSFGYIWEMQSNTIVNKLQSQNKIDSSFNLIQDALNLKNEIWGYDFYNVFVLLIW